MTRITVSGSETAWNCEEGDTIMRAALRAGYGFPYECNVGSCGNCRFDLIEGEIEHLRLDPPGLSEKDKKRGRALGCQARPLTDCTIKVRFAPRYESHFKPAVTNAKLIEILDITHDIREFRFTLDTPSSFLPGQYALLSVPHVDGARAYSMSNTGTDAGEWHFQIRRVPGGSATTQLFDTIKIGDQIKIDGPYGMAYLREDAPRDIICIAGGSGLSPMVSIARAAAQSPALAGRRIDFIYGGRTAKDICGEDLLKVLPGFNETLHYHAAISSDEDLENWDGHQGFVHDLAAKLFGARLAECEIYFAGPPAMGEAIQRVMIEHGVPAEQVHFDQFY